MIASSHLIGASVEDLPSPTVLVDLPTLRRNIAAMATHTQALGVALRPHWKTTKVLEVGRMQLAAGAVGLTAATANEVTALVDGGIPEIFWAFPPIGAARVAVALAAATRTHLIVGVDSLAAITDLAMAAADRGVVIDVRIEVDSGLRRMGVRPENAVSFARVLSRLDGVDLEGVFTHEGHVQRAGRDPERRMAVGVAAGQLLVDVADAIRSDGIPLASVSVGSTPGVRSAPTVAGITEARPGTYVYGDENQVAIGTMTETDTAVTVLSRVCSVQREETILVDAGIKAMSSDSSLHEDGRIGTVVASAGAVLAAGHEEHGFLRGSTGLRVGDLIRIRPNHACGLSNMHSHVVAVEDGVVADVWTVTGRH